MKKDKIQQVTSAGWLQVGHQPKKCAKYPRELWINGEEKME